MPFARRELVNGMATSSARAAEAVSAAHANEPTKARVRRGEVWLMVRCTLQPR